jgi:hypothetical protein
MLDLRADSRADAMTERRAEVRVDLLVTGPDSYREDGLAKVIRKQVTSKAKQKAIGSLSIRDGSNKGR